MRDSGPLVGLIVFVVLSLVFGFMAYTSYSDLVGDDPETTHLDREIEKAQIEAITQEQNLARMRSQIAATRQQLDFEQARFEYLDYLANGENGLYEQAYKGRRKVAEAGKQFEATAKALGEKMAELKQKTKTQLSKDEADLREKTDGDVKKLRDQKEGSLSRAAGEKQAADRDERDYRQRKNYEQSSLDEFRRQLDYLTAREVERATVLGEPDGRVILSDPVHNTIFIGLGTNHGVKNGFRFECFGLRAGLEKVHKAYLEVRCAGAESSECFILTKPVRLPRDPLSEYVANQPEELYSPRQESGKKGALIQPLSGAPKEVLMTMDPLNPIVVGDYVQNPFYRPHKSYTFYIAGDKVITQGVQRSAIAYQWPHIERTVQFHGGSVARKVDLGVDYVIAQRNPQDDAEYNRAVTLGIPVIYEWELFRFLDQE